MLARAGLFARIQQTSFNVETIEPRIGSSGGTDDETDRAPAGHGRKPFVRAKFFPRAKSHIAVYARL